MAVIAPLKRRQNFMPDLVVTHAEELAYLWGQRRAAVHSDTLTLRGLQVLHERIEAHLQGMLVAGAALPTVLADWLTTDERDEVFAIAYALLRSGAANHASAVSGAFREASGPRLDGLRDALGAAPQTFTETTLRACLAQRDLARAAAAAAALASQRRLAPDEAQLGRLLLSNDITTATLAWRTLAVLDPTAGTVTPPYGDALGSPFADLRRAVLGAACWRGESRVAQQVQKLAEAGDVVGLEWWAATGDTTPITPWTSLLATQPGSMRCALIARGGHPSGIETLVDMMSDPDPHTAAAAGTAFTRMTGLDVEGRRQAAPVSADADDFEREFAGELWLPDGARAQQLWHHHAGRWGSGLRWCRGHEISTTLSSGAQATIDLAARWDFGMRAALAGVRLMAPPPVI
ncbi:MAG: hypothetical protein Q7J47_21085 [Azoarcus sp.]|nr:hypothetical protein [Azoarcus sp.]